MMKRVLITNDDGIQAEGLKALEAGLAGVGEVFVVAPEREMSATGQAISIHLPLRVRTLDERHYAVSGTPADAVILALHQLLAAKPHLVVSRPAIDRNSTRLNFNHGYISDAVLCLENDLGDSRNH